MPDASLTLADMQVLAEHDNFLKNTIRRYRIKNYDEFLDVLYDDLEIAIQRLEQNPQHFLDESEDGTTQRLIDILYGMSYAATHNTLAGGNVDITIELSRKCMRWIAEAKKFNSVADLREGYLQLSTRYTPGMGSKDAVHGGLLAYLRRPKASKCMNDWKMHFSDNVSPDSVLFTCAYRGSLGFVSEHDHNVLGIPFRVRHMCVALYFKPEDKSGC